MKEGRDQYLLRLLIVPLAALIGANLGSAQNPGRQVLSTFDIDPIGNREIDGLICVGPPTVELGTRFSPLTIDATFSPSLISNQSLHIVSRSTEPTHLDGPGTIVLSGFNDDSVTAFASQGDLPERTGTNGLTRLQFEKPVSFEFEKGKSLFIYYVTVPGLSDVSFGQLFGNGTKPILVLSADGSPRKPPVVKAVPVKHTSSAPARKPEAGRSSAPVRAGKREPKPLLQALLCRDGGVPSSKNIVARKRTPGPMFKNGPLARIKEAIQKVRVNRGRAPLLAAASILPPKHGDCRPAGCQLGKRSLIVRRANKARRPRPLRFRR